MQNYQLIQLYHDDLMKGPVKSLRPSDAYMRL